MSDKKEKNSKEITDQYSMICQPMFEDIKQGISEQEDAILKNTAAIGLHTFEIRKMSTKIFNGYGVTIQNMSTTLDLELKHNADAHKEIKDGLKRLTNFGATSIVILLVALISILGSIWLTDRSKVSDEVAIQIQKEVKAAIEEAVITPESIPGTPRNE